MLVIKFKNSNQAMKSSLIKLAESDGCREEDENLCCCWYLHAWVLLSQARNEIRLCFMLKLQTDPQVRSGVLSIVQIHIYI